MKYLKLFGSVDKIIANFLKIFIIRRIYLLITGTEHKNSKKQANSRAYPSAINTCAKGPLKMKLHIFKIKIYPVSGPGGDSRRL